MPPVPSSVHHPIEVQDDPEEETWEDDGEYNESNTWCENEDATMDDDADMDDDDVVNDQDDEGNYGWEFDDDEDDSPPNSEEKEAEKYPSLASSEETTLLCQLDKEIQDARMTTSTIDEPSPSAEADAEGSPA